ncbi:MAG: hypothetical protein D6694_05410 [Gammaproteobacteria bacterium]|nr:MAG: hypothetical protein D6694_05410 [Gammaproteobacteria bacterium]
MPRSKEHQKYIEKAKEILAAQPPMSPQEFAEQTKRVLRNARPIMTTWEKYLKEGTSVPDRGDNLPTQESENSKSHLFKREE